jgi:hypothetical protein
VTDLRFEAGLADRVARGELTREQADALSARHTEMLRDARADAEAHEADRMSAAWIAMSKVAAEHGFDLVVVVEEYGGRKVLRPDLGQLRAKREEPAKDGS